MDTTKEYILLKQCSKCLIVKHLYDFSKDTASKSWKRSYCKRCQSLYNISHPHKNDSVKRKEYDKKHQVKEEYKVKHREDAKKHRKKYPHKIKARFAGQVLPKQLCEVCGEKAEAYHDDYSNPHIVRWLCEYHHERVR